MRERRLLMAAMACLSLALLAFLFADTKALPEERSAWACGDWWCAPENTLPVGLGLLLAAVGLVAFSIAVVGRPDEPEKRAPAPPRRSRGPH